MTAGATLTQRLPAPLRVLAGRHGALLSNAGALASGTIVTAVLGFAYWWIAARAFPPRAVGYAAAAMSMINLLAHVGEFGMGPFLIGHRLRSGEEAGAVVTTALSAVVISCGLAALAYLILQSLLAAPLGAIADSPGTYAMFIAAVALTGFTLVLDQALVGLLLSVLQMTRNVVASLAKLALLLAAALLVGRDAGEGLIFDTWILGQALSLVIVADALRRRPVRAWPRPRAYLLRPLVGEILRHHVLNIALQAPALALPFIVTVILSPATNAAFFAAWSLVAVALLVPASLATVVYSTVAREPIQMASRLTLSLGISALACTVAGLAFLICSQAILGLFSPAYPVLAGPSLRLLGLGTFGIAMKYHYVAVQRLRGRMMSAAVWLGLGACAELAMATFGALDHGLTGLTCGWLAGIGLEAIVVTPTLLRAASGRLTLPADALGAAIEPALTPIVSEVA